ncbi:MAG: ribosome maturation factor RimM [Aquisalimonadaceae bacterium]
MTTRLITIGRISGIHGVAGWVKIRSDTQPRDNILTYPRWLVRREGQWQEMVLVEGRMQGKGIVAALQGVNDREQARELMGADIALPRDALPPLPEGEYYWADLEGLEVITVDGVALGRLHHLIETGANDVMVVRGDRERLIPMVIGQYVTRVDLAQGLIEVDWDPDF